MWDANRGGQHPRKSSASDHKSAKQQRAASASAEQRPATLRQAFLLERAGDLDGARGVLLQIVAESRENQQYREALAACRKALSIREDVNTHLIASDICFEMSREDESVAHLRRAGKFLAARQPNTRLRIARRIAALRPDDPRLLIQFAEVAQEAGQEELAERAHAKARELTAHLALKKLNTQSEEDEFADCTETEPTLAQSRADIRRLTQQRRRSSASSGVSVSVRGASPKPTANRLEAALPTHAGNESEARLRRETTALRNSAASKPAKNAPAGSVADALSSPAGVVAQNSLEWVDVSSSPSQGAEDDRLRDSDEKENDPLFDFL